MESCSAHFLVCKTVAPIRAVVSKANDTAEGQYIVASRRWWADAGHCYFFGIVVVALVNVQWNRLHSGEARLAPRPGRC